MHKAKKWQATTRETPSASALLPQIAVNLTISLFIYIMLGISFDKPQDSALEILCLGAHSDDIEIGCGGTILKLTRDYPNTAVTWIVFASQGERIVEAQKSALEFLTAVDKRNIVIKDFRDGFFPYQGAAIKEYFEQLKQDVSPDLIFTHCRHDLHQDHRLICELTWNTFRDHFILEYEIPKFDGDLGVPNLFVHLDERICEKKIDNLIRHFQTQGNKRWFTDDTFKALMRLRGVESQAQEKYAEAFYVRKIIL